MDSATRVGTDLEHIHRFLIYGRDDGAYFTSSSTMQDFTTHSQSIDRMLASGRGREVVELIRKVSIDGRAPKQSGLLYALSICARCNDPQTKDAAYRCLPVVCRIPTHLFEFVKYITRRNGMKSGGWGRAPRKAISEWFNQEKFQRNPMKLLRVGTKYKKRHSYSHRDLIRLAHVKPRTRHVEFVIRYLAKGMIDVQNFEQPDGLINEAKKFVFATELAKRYTSRDIEHLTLLIRDYQLTREHIPTHLLNSPEVWKALLYVMPITALVRNLGKLSKLRLLEPGTLEEQHVVEILLDDVKLRSARVHPLSLLTAWNTYKSGQSFASGRMGWEVNDTIANVIETAFYRSFSFTDGTGKRILFALDGCEGMIQPVNGMPVVMARSAAVAVALLMSKIEPNAEFVVVSNEVSTVDIDQNDNLESGSAKFSTQSSVCMCSDACKPIIWASQNDKVFDAIVFFSANVVHGRQTAAEAMRQYREKTGLPRTRLVVVSMTSNSNSVTDQDDFDMLNVVGFDTNAFKVISDFIRG